MRHKEGLTLFLARFAAEEGLTPRGKAEMVDLASQLARRLGVGKLQGSVTLRATRGCDLVTFEGSPYLSGLSCPYSVSGAHLVGTSAHLSKVPNDGRIS